MSFCETLISFGQFLFQLLLSFFDQLLSGVYAGVIFMVLEGQ